jgi:hypothetical protein
MSNHPECRSDLNQEFIQMPAITLDRPVGGGKCLDYVQQMGAYPPQLFLNPVPSP